MRASAHFKAGSSTPSAKWRATLLALSAFACSNGAPEAGAGGAPVAGTSSLVAGEGGGGSGTGGSSALGGAAAGSNAAGATAGASAAGSATTAGESSGGSPSSGGGPSDGGSAGSAGQAGAPATSDPSVAWVLSYFGPEQSVAADSLHLAYSTDGLHWTRFGSGGPAYQLTNLGTNHIRDPFILRKADGSFVYLATDWTLSNNDSNYWNNPSSKIFVADSKDLIAFENPRLLPLTTAKGPGGKPRHAWAPEAYYDAAGDRYLIIWSGNDAQDRNRIYGSYTQDFRTLSAADPEVFFDPGYSVIDGTVARWNGSSHLFFKDETDNNGGESTGSGKDIQVAHAPSETLEPGSFVRSDAGYIPRGASQGTRQATEGPFVIKHPEQELWYLFADFYTQGGKFGCWSTTDLNAKPSAWKRVAPDDYSFPSGVRHANTVRVTQAELDALKAHYR